MNVVVHPTNASAHAVDFAVHVHRLLGGRDFKALAERELTRSVNLASTVNRRLAPVNASLAGLVRPGSKVDLIEQNGFLLRVSNSGLLPPVAAPVDMLH